MPLARIFSRYPQQAAALSLALQQKGYTVEVLTPEQTPASSAHFEAACGRERGGGRAGVHGRNPDERKDLEIQVEVCEPAEVLRRAEELASQLHADIAIAPGALPEDSVSAPTTAAPEVPAAASEPAILPAAPKAAVPEAPAQPVSSTSHAPSARASSAALAALGAAAGDWLASAWAAFDERLEQTRVLAAEASARRQERLLELARRRAGARQRAVTAESSRRALAVYLLQLQSEYPLPDAALDAVTDPASVGGPPASASRTGVPGAPDVGARGWETKIKRLRMTKREALLAAAASATALFVAGLAIASFHSLPALSPKPDVPAQSSSVNLHGPQPKPPSPSRPSPAVGKTKPRPAKARQAHPNVRPKPQPRDQVLVARDVVIRHFPTPKPTPSPQTNGWKHFSDLNR